MRVTGAQLAMLIEGLTEWSRVVPKVTKAADERLLNCRVLLEIASIFV